MPDLDQQHMQLGIRVQAEIDAFRTSHVEIMSALTALESALTPEQAPAFASLREALLANYRDQRLMGALLEELAKYNRVLVAQRQSAREMFLQGGEAVIADLLALATGPEFAQLRRLISHLAAHDDTTF